MVNELLEKNNYETTARINQPFKEIFKKLYDEYKIIHIASHGVIEYGEDKKTGILLSDNIVLTAAEINQISSTPELVFINSCYMGAVSSDREKHFRNKYKLAANVGTQFIENGVKAVVVAGWAVNDAAAKRFAQIFYEKMLEGEIFAEAVKAARMACFKDYPNTNTWGAYQCYGDQFYQLRKKRRTKDEEHGYILEKEILIDLEKFIDQTKSSSRNKVDLLTKLQNISKAIDKSPLRNGTISELEVKAYFELDQYDVVLSKLDELFLQNDAIYSVKALELWCISKVRSLKQLDPIKNKKKIEQGLNDTIKRMNQLINLGDTSERNNIMGGVYKRLSNFVNASKRKTAIKKCAHHYKMGYELSQQKDEIYPLTGWIIAELIGGDKKGIEAMNKHLDADALQFLQKLSAELNDNISDHDEFWDMIKPVNLKQAELLFYLEEETDKRNETQSKNKKRKQLVIEIKSLYADSWKRGGGAIRHKSGEIEQMQFIIKSLEVLESKKRNINGTLGAFKELLKFFQEI